MIVEITNNENYRVRVQMGHISKFWVQKKHTYIFIRDVSSYHKHPVHTRPRK